MTTPNAFLCKGKPDEAVRLGDIRQGMLAEIVACDESLVVGWVVQRCNKWIICIGSPTHWDIQDVEN